MGAHNYWQFTQYTSHRVRKTTIDKMGRKDKQSPQRGKKIRGPDNISTNDPRESNPR